MEKSRGNIYVSYTHRDNNGELRHGIEDENPYVKMNDQEPHVRGGQRQMPRNPDSATSQHATDKDSAQNEINSTDKCVRIAVALLTVSVIAALILSAVSMVIMLQFHNQTTAMQKRTRAEIKEMKAYLEKQQAEISKVQFQDQKLNQSLSLLRDQTNETGESIMAEIKGIKASVEYHQEEITEVKFQDLELNLSLSVLRDQTNRTQQNILANITEMKKFDETQQGDIKQGQIRDLELNQTLKGLREQFNETQEQNLASITEIKEVIKIQQEKLTKVQIQDSQLNKSQTVLKEQINVLNRTVTTSSLVTTEGGNSNWIEYMYSAINETKAESSACVASYMLLNGTVQQHASEIKQLSRTVNAIRLVEGSQNFGRVEIFHNERWGTICDDHWDMNDATVVCRMLGYQGASAAPCCARYGQGTGQIWLDDVSCTGAEETIRRCPSISWGAHNCNHAEDASVVCY